MVKCPLSQIFNESINLCSFPSKLKSANVVPLFKKDDNTNKENYRLISILPTISKLFERLMFQQVTDFINDFISPYLCGFRKGYNTQHALLSLMNKLNNSLDRKEKVGLFMMDLSKAFDCIPHELLIAKLHAYGFGKQSLKPIYDYLKSEKKNILFVIGASWDSKKYSKEKFVELIKMLDFNCLLVWGNENEYNDAVYIEKRTDALILPKMSLNTLKAIISKSDLVLGNDTGPTHMAWALNIPSLTLFGNTPGYRNTYQTKINKIIESNSLVDANHLDKKDYSISTIETNDILFIVKELLA